MRVLGDPYGDGTPGNFLNSTAFASPALGTFGNVGMGSIKGPARGSSISPSPETSEQKLQGKLDLPRSSHDRRNGAGVGVRAAVAAEGAQRGHGEIGVVQDIEEFRAKLETRCLSDLGLLRQIDVQSRVAG